jgi:hypothetical protein
MTGPHDWIYTTPRDMTPGQLRKVRVESLTFVIPA